MIVAIQGAINNELAMNNATVQLSAILKLLSTEYILGQWPSQPGTFHFLIGKFCYFVIRFLY